ncbi:MAG: RICIN domain-containing protein [Bacteroidales bacterium]|nr:RICIN domain-containing protein [Bacteroidales bacterium]
MQKEAFFYVLIMLLTGSLVGNITAQTNSTEVTSSGNFLVPQPVPDRHVPFSVADTGVSKILTWGLDTAWPSEGNIRRGVAFMGADRVDLVRASFQPTLPLVDGDLQQEQVEWINTRLALVDLTGPDTKVVLNCDHSTVDPWYDGNAARWAQLMDVTARRVQEHGREIVSIAPFNEPDYGWGQGTISDFYNIAGELRQNPRFQGVRISGGNTLNTDQALYWYNQLKDRLDEGNTHQLAGSFDNYATFFETVRANGHHATNDELHNVMEAMVGVEYGMQTGIWWGTAELARGEFVRASDGKRLGYAEHRPNWTAASVYRSPSGKVQAFGGSSERQAATTSYLFVSRDRDVYYDGHGPMREYFMEIPGGTGYQQGQTNAERVVNISWGDDIQPLINGRYILVNRKSGMVMEVANGATGAGTTVRQGTSTGATYQQWNVQPVDPRVGGDFSYYTLTAQHSGKALDVLNWSLDNGTNMIVWDDVKGANQQWFLEYAGDGWFYIRSRHSAKCLDIYNGSTTAGAGIIQWDKNEGAVQQWRLLPVDAPVEFDPPQAPGDVETVGNAVSVRLDWSASPDSDVAGYTVYRSAPGEYSYQTIARNVTTTTFVDNTVVPGKEYQYAVRAVDHSLNHSGYSATATATATGEEDLIARLQFEANTLDTSVHLNHGAASGEITFVEGKFGSGALALNGTDDFLQLPATLVHHREITIAAWVRWNGGAPWQRIFDFGNDQSSGMYLTPRMRFTLKHAGTEHRLDAATLPEGEWAHVAVTLGGSWAKLYFNGAVVDSLSDPTIGPMDIMPVLNYIGRSQTQVPFFNGYIDEFRVYNYVLPADKIALLLEEEEEGNGTGIAEPADNDAGELMLWPVPANDQLHLDSDLLLGSKGNSVVTIFDMQGKVVITGNIEGSDKTQLDVSGLSAGTYLLRIGTSEQSVSGRFTIKP